MNISALHQSVNDIKLLVPAYSFIILHDQASVS